MYEEVIHIRKPRYQLIAYHLSRDKEIASINNMVTVFSNTSINILIHFKFHLMFNRLHNSSRTAHNVKPFKQLGKTMEENKLAINFRT